MPYKILKKKGARPFKIVNKLTKKVVGSSMTRAKATRSIGHRTNAELIKEEEKWRKNRKVVK
jgi:hypothetical protein